MVRLLAHTAAYGCNHPPPRAAPLLDHLRRSRGQAAGAGAAPRVGDVRRRDGRARAAVLSEHRGQDRAIRRRRATPDLPRTRGSGHGRALRERALDLAAGGRATRDAAGDPRSRARGHDACRLCDRVRLPAADAAASHSGDAGPAGALPRRSGERHHRLRGGGRAGRARRPQCRLPRARTRDPRARSRDLVPRRTRRRPRHARRRRAVSTLHFALGVPADGTAGQRARAPLPDRMRARPAHRRGTRARGAAARRRSARHRPRAGDDDLPPGGRGRPRPCGGARTRVRRADHRGRGSSKSSAS